MVGAHRHLDFVAAACPTVVGTGPAFRSLALKAEPRVGRNLASTHKPVARRNLVRAIRNLRRVGHSPERAARSPGKAARNLELACRKPKVISFVVVGHIVAGHTAGAWRRLGPSLAIRKPEAVRRLKVGPSARILVVAIADAMERHSFLQAYHSPESDCMLAAEQAVAYQVIADLAAS